jgi:alkylation response protein AidB-like acyl-CoA dehydrogenase
VCQSSAGLALQPLARWSEPEQGQTTQIYEGTNQINRMVMARNLLK